MIREHEKKKSMPLSFHFENLKRRIDHDVYTVAVDDKFDSSSGTVPVNLFSIRLLR
jgi:hypothetical protein